MAWLDDMRKKDNARKESAKLARGLDTPSGNPVGQWIQGVAQRTLHPLETLANESTRWRNMPTGELASNLISGDGASLASLVGMMAGKGAKTADLAKLALAEKLKAKGVADADIWKNTGWTLDTPDKIPRFEIPDNAAAYNEKMPTWDRLTEAKPISKSFQHEQAYSAYPDTAGIPLNQAETGHGVYRGESGADSIGVGGLLPQNKYSNKKHYELAKGGIKSTTLHELQHAIQQREGFASGGSPEMFNQADEAKIAADALSWKRELLRKRTEMPKADWSAVENAVVQDYQRIGAMDMLPSRDARNLANQPYVLHGEKVAPDELAGVEELVKMYGLDQRTTPAKPMDLYKRLAGEAEARLTQARMDMTPEQRLAQYPYDPAYFEQATGVPLNSLIVRKQ